MPENIYVYYNADDFRDLIELIQSNGAFVYSSQFELITGSEFDTNDVFYVFSERVQLKNALGIESFNHIQIWPPYNNPVQSGNISLNLISDDIALSDIFKLIFKFIKENYVLSDGRYHYYAGPSFYNDWLERKVTLAGIFKYRTIKIARETSDFKDFVEHITKNGFHISENGYDIRKTDFNYDSDSYIIYHENSQLDKRQDRRWMLYSTDSECVFLHFRKSKAGKTEYIFSIDDRLSGNDEIETLVDLIESYSF